MYKVASLFAGVGGIDIGFENTDEFKTVWANEFDPKAQQTYKQNFDNVLNVQDIRDVDPEEIPEIDVLLSGFPCTSFSIAGYRKGFEDEHSGDLFLETLRIIVAKQPKVVFLENVKNLLGHDKGKTFKIIYDALTQNGYTIKYQVLNAKEFGNIPQNRERIYIVGFKNEDHAKNFEFPTPVDLTTSIESLLEKKVDEKYFYSLKNCKFYDQLTDIIVDENTMYQWRRKYVRENKSGVCPTLTANMGTGGHNVPLINQNGRIRKLTPRECFNFQGYPENYILPEIANSHLYKQAGNSVVVPVINRIANNILLALNAEEIPLDKQMKAFFEAEGIGSFEEFIEIWKSNKII